MSMPITLERAIDLVLEYTPVLEEEQASLMASIGRTLSRDIYAPLDQPPFDRSPLDGYAVIASDIQGAAVSSPVVLQVVDKLYAGDVSATPVSSGQAVRLMTGSMIPVGADCVIRQEDTDGGEETVRIYRVERKGSNYCRRGEEYTRGTRLLTAGQKVDPAAAAVAAAAGMAVLPVRRRPRVALLATGDEIQQSCTPLAPGKIYDANTGYLASRLFQLGADVAASALVGDRLQDIAAVLRELEGEADVIVTTGGVSVGQKDLVCSALKYAGAGIVFHGITIKPGMPTLFAAKAKTLYLGLSGNPFAAAVPFELIFRSMLARMVQDESLLPRPVLAPAAHAFQKKGQMRRFLRAVYENGAVTIPGGQSNGQMRSMIGCNCLVDLSPQTTDIRPGTPLSIFLL